MFAVNSAFAAKYPAPAIGAPVVVAHIAPAETAEEAAAETGGEEAAEEAGDETGGEEAAEEAAVEETDEAAAEETGGEEAAEEQAVEETAEEAAEETGGEEAEEEKAAQLDRSWVPIQGPFYARRAPPSRQPKGANAGRWKVYVVVVPFDPVSTIMYPSGELRFLVPGASEGIMQRLPSSWGSADTSFVFRLRLDPSVTASVITIDSLLHRRPPFPDDESDASGAPPPADDGGEDTLLSDDPPLDEGSPAVVPLSVVPAGMLPRAEPAVVDTEWDAVRAAAELPPPPPPLSAEEAPPQNEANLPPAEEVADMEVAGLEMDNAEPAPAPAPSPAPAAPHPPPAAPERVSQRSVRKRARYGDAGELDGAASSFRSEPPLRKPSIDPSYEMGVPEYVVPGSQVLAYGLHAGSRKRFRAQVSAVRKSDPSAPMPPLHALRTVEYSNLCFLRWSDSAHSSRGSSFATPRPRTAVGRIR